jgi:predicted porin
VVALAAVLGIGIGRESAAQGPPPIPEPAKPAPSGPPLKARGVPGPPEAEPQPEETPRPPAVAADRFEPPPTGAAGPFITLPAFRYLDPSPFLPSVGGPLALPPTIGLSVAVDETYQSNTARAGTGQQRRGDFTTTVVPALALNYPIQLGTVSFKLAYSPQFNFHVEHPDLNAINHSLLAQATWRPKDRLEIGVSGGLARSDNLRDLDESGLAPTGRRTATRAQVTPRLRYQWTPQVESNLTYTRSFLLSGDPNADQSDVSQVAQSFRTQLSEATSLQASYEFTDGRFRGSTDFQGHTLSLGLGTALTPRLRPNLTVSLAYRDQKADPDLPPATDSTTVTATLGASYQLTPDITIQASAGASYFDPKGGVSAVNFNFAGGSGISLLRWPLTLSLNYNSGLSESFLELQNVGTTRTHVVSLNATRALGPDLALNATAAFRRSEFLTTTVFRAAGTHDSVLTVSVGANYRLSRTISLSASYDFIRRLSAAPGQGLVDHRAHLGLRFSIGL